MNSIYMRNFLMTASFVILSFLILGVSFVFLARSYVISEKRGSMSSNAQEVARYVQSSYKANRYEAIGAQEVMVIASFASSLTENTVFITDSEGLIVICSDSLRFACKHIGAQLPSQVLQTVSSNGSYDTLTDLDGIFSENNYVYVLPVLDDRNGDTIGLVVIGSASTQIFEIWGTFSQMFVMIGAVIIFMALVLSFITSKKQARPLNAMSAASRRYARGDFSVRVEIDPERDDEVAVLTHSFNNMAEALGQSEERRREFIANISHELKTPMTTISGFADGILDGTIPPEDQNKYLETISLETKRLSRMVRRMLEMSQVQSLNDSVLTNSFDICEILRRALINFETKITDKELEVDAQLPEGEMLVRGDQDAIMQVANNLLDNAVKFSQKGSVLGMSVWKQGGKAYVSVKNHGETIAESELPLIFERFHKTDRSRGKDKDGVGLGLYIVKQILNNHEEDIAVTSKDGLTEFVFSLSLKE